MLNLEPKKVWDYFEELSAIPRPSKHEEAAGDFAVRVAKDHGLDWKRDAVGNVVVLLPATKGREKAATTILQSHIDMVCEKNAGIHHDFMNDPIKLLVKGNIITADGTTLGADNGIGVAMSLALLDENKAVHGPLELLFTVDEETGMNGALGLKPGFLKGRRMLNLDTEEDGELYVGCAGGIDTTMFLPVERVKRNDARDAYKLAVTGLRGGHSGCDIQEGRGNANRILARFLQALDAKGIPYGLSRVSGGSKRNAIAREAFATLHLDDNTVRRARGTAKTLQTTLREELKGTDDGVSLKLSKSTATINPLKETSRRKLVTLLGAVPHGLISYSREMPGLVETSTNFAIIDSRPAKVEIATSQRSSVDSQLDWAAQWVADIGLLAGAKIVQSDGYPGWKPNLKSKILKAAQSTYKRLFNVEPEPKAIHAGLECGLIGAKFQGMDMVSMGPEIRNVHSPDEEVHVDSVKKTYKYLLALLQDIS